MAGRTSSSGARLALVVFIVVQAITWSHSRYAHDGGESSMSRRGAQGLGLGKRSEPRVLPLLGVPNGAALNEEVSATCPFILFLQSLWTTWQ